MNLQKTWLAPSIGALLPLLLCASAAATQMMGAPVARTQRAEQGVVMQLDNRRAYKGFDQDHGFHVKSHHPGVAGTAITRAAHTYKGVRVFHAESVVVTNPVGTLLSEARSNRGDGLGRGPDNAAPGAPPRGRFANFSVTPVISSADAIAFAVKTTTPGASHVQSPVAELIIYPVVTSVRTAAAAGKTDAQLNALDMVDQVSGYELAYLVQTRMASGTRPIFHDTVVSANDGRILAQWRTLKTVAGTGKSQYNGMVPLNTTLTGSTYTMKDTTRGVGGAYGGMAVTNANHGTTAGAIYSSTTNTWGDGLQYVEGGSTISANGQTAAVNAMWGLMNTYDMLKNVLGWQSLDGNNTATYIAAHVNTAYDNAYYSDACRCMYIGDGNSFKSLGSLDVIGHEMGHGITAATSNLTYWGESGGLNESASDINGEMVEAYARGGGTGTTIPATGNDWQMGTEISKTGTPLRYMYKPSLDGGSPNAWSSTLGNLDVHYSSGPNNRMFYFLAQGSNASTTSNFYSAYLTQLPKAMTGIGSDKAYRIWFRALTTKFTASTNYADARAKVLLAAQELYGVGSKEATAVQRAYAAINVGADVAELTAVAIASNPVSVSVLTGATASFTATASGGTVPYKYQWLRNGAAIAGATAASYSLVTKMTDTGALFSVKITDSATTPTSATSTAATLTVTLPTVAIASQPASVSVLAGATASFAVTASGGTAPYKYQWVRNGAAIASATAATYSLVTKAADTGAVFSVKVTDSAATPTSATSASATLTVKVPAVAIASNPASVSVLAGATASFAVGATSGTAPYKYQWLRNGAAIAGATAASYSLVTKTTDTGAVFSVKVTDSATTPTSATSTNATLTVKVALAIASNPANVSVLAGTAASFAVTASGGTAPYKYQWLRNGAAIAGATAASYSLVTKASDTGAVFSVKVTDSATAPATATSANATLTVKVPVVAIASNPASVSVLAGATASFAVSATSGTAPYKYQWLRNGAAIAGATASSYTLVTKAADTGAVFSVKVTDSAVTPTAATSANATLTVKVPAVAIASNPASVSVLAGATASFAVGATSGTAPYKFQWMRNGVAIAGATAASYSLVTKAADSGAVFSVKVTDSAATPTSATSANATLTVKVPMVAIASNPASVNVLAGATASFAVGASGGTAPYKYQWLRNGAAIAGATAASYSLVTKAADTGAVFSVKVIDSAATPTAAISGNATLTVTVPMVAIASQPGSVSVLAGATASFAVGASGGTAPYKYQWLRNGAAIAGATAASYSLVTKAADSGAVFSVKVTDSAAMPTSATSTNATLAVTVISAVERIVNGGFEAGVTGWSGTIGVIGSWAGSGQVAAEGSKFGYLGGNGTMTIEALAQAVVLPATATSANLSFALHIDTAETTTNIAYDRLEVAVRNTAGTVLGTLATYSNLNKATGYTTRTFNLLPYKGQTVILTFVMVEDSIAQTTFTIDKVSVLTQ